MAETVLKPVAIPQEQFLDKVMVITTGYWSRQFSSTKGAAVGRQHPCGDAIMVQTVQKTVEISPVAVHMVVDVPVVPLQVRALGCRCVLAATGGWHARRHADTAQFIIAVM